MKKEQLRVLISEENKLYILGTIVFYFQGTQVVSIQHMTHKLNYSTIIHLN